MHTGVVELLQVVHQLRIALDFQRAGELGLVDIAVAAQIVGCLDDSLRLSLGDHVLGLFHAVDLVGEVQGFEQEEDIVLDALVVDLFREGEVSLGAVELPRLELGQQLHRVGPAPLDLRHAPTRLDRADRAPTSFLSPPDISTRMSKPVEAGTANAATVLA